MKTFRDLSVGDKVYCIHNESYQYSPFSTYVTNIEDEEDGTLRIECKGLKPFYTELDDSQCWEDNKCVDVFTDKDEFYILLTKKIEELTDYRNNYL